MATLADAGQRTTNENNPFPYADPKIQENNPYQQALQGGAAANVFAGTPNPSMGLSQKVPSQVPAGDLSGPRDSSSAATGVEQKMLESEAAANNPSSSVADTPEAMTPAQTQADQATALKTLESHQKAANANITSNGKTPSPSQPTAQQNINAALAPDQAILDSLPAEYKSTMSQLAPYLNSGQDTGNTALNAADAAVAKVAGNTNDPVEAALKQLPKDSKEYAQSVSTQPLIQALLGFGKYEETYAGAQPTGQSNWSSQMDEIYKYLSGSNASTNGLPTPTSAAATAGSSNVATSTGAGGGNA